MFWLLVALGLAAVCFFAYRADRRSGRRTPIRGGDVAPGKNGADATLQHRGQVDGLGGPMGGGPGGL